MRCAPRLAFHFERRRARADEAAECIARAARLRERLARRDQLLLQPRVLRKQRRQRFQFVEQREADRADRRAGIVLQRQTRDDERLAIGLHDVEQDRLAGVDDFAHQTVRDHRFAIAADRLLRVRKAEARRIPFIDPDNARLPVYDEGAFTEVFERAKQRFHRPTQHVVVGGGQARPVGHHAVVVSTCRFVCNQSQLLDKFISKQRQATGLIHRDLPWFQVILAGLKSRFGDTRVQSANDASGRRCTPAPGATALQRTNAGHGMESAFRPRRAVA
ncbi:hypothetical protein OKW50_005926 [Paraburkholderia youngii]